MRHRVDLVVGLLFALVTLGTAQAQVGFDRLGADYAPVHRLYAREDTWLDHASSACASTSR